MKFIKHICIIPLLCIFLSKVDNFNTSPKTKNFNISHYYTNPTKYDGFKIYRVSYKHIDEQIREVESTNNILATDSGYYLNVVVYEYG